MNIKKAVLALINLCINKEYRRLSFISIFDPGYYLSLRGKSIVDDLNSLWTDVKNGKDKTIVRQRRGADWSQQADPHPLFDTSYYLLHYFPKGLDEIPFVHYLHTGWKNGFRPGPFFDPEIYAAWSGWTPADGDPLSHYSRHGQKQAKSPGLNFDFDFYSDKNPNLSGVEHELIRHYKLHGAPSGKSPLPLFDPQFYLGQLAPTEDIVFDPLSHYLSTANSSVLCPGKLFDPDFYIGQCGKDLTRADALTHYVTRGVFEGVYCHSRVASLTCTPVISILVPVYNPDPAVLRNCIRSVLYQAYPHWELCLADDCSSREDVRPLLEEWAEKDSRIKVTFLTANAGIARATNEAALLASGKYLGFLDNDDELTVDCLLEVVEVINDQDADLVYTDEDLIGNNGRTLSVFRKPDFNPGLLFSHNYITHFVTVKRSLFEEVGGLDSKYDGAQDFDLMLKLSEVSGNIVHIPRVLYHWRASESSTSINHGEKNYANEAGRLALEAAVGRRQLPYKVANTELNFFYHLLSDHNVATGFTVLIWGVEMAELDPDFLHSLGVGFGDVRVEYVFIANTDNKTQFSSVLEGLPQTTWTICTPGENETKALLLHRLISKSTGEYVILVDGAVKKLSINWLVELSSPFVQPDVAMVCGRTTYNGGDGASYLLPDIVNNSATYFQEFLHSSARHMAGLHCPQDISCGGWDLTMIRKEAYTAVGGFFWEQFPEIFAMADLSVLFRGSGKRVIYTPFAVGDKEVESLCRGVEDSEEMRQEKHRFQSSLQERTISIDHFYNRGLLVDHGVDESSYLQWLKE
ncbi:MAG: glycosyltransferase involved in cell wall biosynthesis [Desulforhopalus sp.]|jgi:glycosyltransferase involved in cell wall biosynthesis